MSTPTVIQVFLFVLSSFKLLDFSSYVEIYEVVGLGIVQFDCQFRPFMRYLRKAYVIRFRGGYACLSVRATVSFP